MLKSSIDNISKKIISKEIHKVTGLPKQYSKEIIDDFIFILKNLIKENKTTIKKFGCFKVINKKERMGRNPKSKEKSVIPARKSISFISSKNFKINTND